MEDMFCAVWGISLKDQNIVFYLILTIIVNIDIYCSYEDGYVLSVNAVCEDIRNFKNVLQR